MAMITEFAVNASPSTVSDTSGSFDVHVDQHSASGLF